MDTEANIYHRGYENDIQKKIEIDYLFRCNYESYKGHKTVNGEYEHESRYGIRETRYLE